MAATIPPGLDSRLVQGFQRAIEGRGDGRVSETDVKEMIAPLLSGDGALSEVEKKTLEWAVNEFKLTGSARRALSDEITRLHGAPVFQWQRELGGVMSVRLDTGLPQAQLDRKAAAAFQSNTPALSNEWGNDVLYNHPESGNSGSHVQRMEGEAAERHLKFLAAVLHRPELLTDFSAETHAVYSVYESDDEEHFGGILVDKRTGEATALPTYNIVDASYDISLAQWEDMFGPVLDDNGNRITDPDEFADFASETDVGELLGRDAPEVELPNYSRAQIERRDDVLWPAFKDMHEQLRNATGDRKAVADTGVMARTDNLDGRLLALADAMSDSDWRDRMPRGQNPQIVESFRAFDAAAKDAIVASMKQGNPSLDGAKIDAVLGALGDASGLKYAVVDIPMTMRDNAANTDVAFTVRSHIVVNEKEGDWFGIYDRPTVQGE